MIESDHCGRDGHVTWARSVAGALLSFFALALPTPWAGSDAFAQEPAAPNARSLAATCANCHGTDGRSVGGIPPLAGYPAERLVTDMADFKRGSRPATIMHQIAKGYTDAQIAALAAYFAARGN